MIDHVQDRVGRELAHAVGDRRQVGRAVEERAIFLLYEQRRVEARQEDADGALAERGDVALSQVGHHVAERVVVEAFAS